MADVSRETPPAPPSARTVFGAALPVAEGYAHLLAADGVVRGLIGPREVPRLWERHLVNCAVLAEAIDEGRRVGDLGSGAGLPGLVLALLRADLEITLVEPLLRRTSFLDQAVTALSLGNVEVVRARAEQLHGRRTFDIVTARALAPLDRLLGWAMPLVEPGGALLAMKGATVAEEVEHASAAGLLRGYTVSIQQYGADVINPPTTALRVETVRTGR
ncbi:MAG: 16S rRNA (guanine(527)-N(7))-methyltransferase [uncultured Nocardioidaceae bacterium]|uniref:Ribosomal RNA small subunit methyltransferase G n=1 Tax=uncultured Nocardioidaceae bacterium TaxID=253824 RepID=A0A6J4LTR9_9ACTN|nr:MAG: 16S rRNA (guanine(527)-N(7))-methyltransferase [uncultured Nocardioidaceae bacterium]